MDDKARLGRCNLVVVIVATALVELALAALSLQAGRFRAAQVGRALLTGWLLWRVWDGAGWARWLMAGLCLTGGVFAVALGLTSPAVEGRPGVTALMLGFAVVLTGFGLGLASPWVGAYQAARRADARTEAGDGPGR